MRFKYYPVSQIIEDKCTGKRYYGNKELAVLLNELHETIQSLISDSEKYRKLSIQFDNRNKELVSENALLEKENEQLKHSIKCLEADKMELQQYIKRMQGDVE